jgi:4-hydroxybenzoate polyprenyltransferase/phosphoserine phosphatase
MSQAISTRDQRLQPLSAADAAVSHDEQAANAPLCVDLDGTLVKTNTLHELFLALLGNLQALLSIPYWLFRGKARLKHELARRVNLDAALFPYNEDLLDYLAKQKRAGRRLVLCTAADQRIARAVSDYLGVFDEVLASENGRNLRGAEKARALVDRFGSGNFTYAGNDYTDLPVWREAKSAILVNTPPAIAKALSGSVPIELLIERSRRSLSAWLRALRPHQWVKNLLVFVPIVTANATGRLGDWLSAVFLFMAFCAVASSIYLFNDLTDLAADRQHRKKKTRPFACGALPIWAGVASIPVLLLGGLIAAAMSGALPAVALYAAISIGYSLWLKEFALVDLFALATLYTLRLFAGGEATHHAVSLWLLGFSSFLFFSLAIVKRISELMQHEDATTTLPRRGYGANDLQILQLMGVSSSFVSAMILALYVQSHEVAVRYSHPRVLWLLVPVMLFWQCRVWLVTARGAMHDDPLIYAANDWVSRAVVLGLVLIFFLAGLAF